ncbi:hypothetical protein TBLA_0B06800 [Henningerozyma blattae CBS 6284]|uniref:Uncharacterized protein n=1 Tax=Henningerozyma blattae (strain ATCC 34711 / CBS 6284 / DSM 70876 / NBRC 10599 / NRRL Y-10934 / UCD 77-7) TaxID=1071380 RepID=I2GZE8_HENB6|nr:hypothetical protein TBLA_0B06800 [Tetrapisispora blattae CBS 6284]CCH59500.1 hypothetical protein TBLA_0B06800 [Tetrapisispora blattae CBS 6284]
MTTTQNATCSVKNSKSLEQQSQNIQQSQPIKYVHTTWTASFVETKNPINNGNLDLGGSDFHNSNNAITNFNTMNYSYIDPDEGEDMIVDLNSGSLTPINLNTWTLLNDVTDKFHDL